MCRPRYYITKKADQDSSLLVDNETHRTDSLEEAVITARQRGGNLIWDDQEMEFFEVGSTEAERHVPIKMNEANARSAKEFYKKENPMNWKDSPDAVDDWYFGENDMVRFAEAYHQHKLASNEVLRVDIPDEELINLRLNRSTTEIKEIKIDKI